MTASVAFWNRLAKRYARMPVADEATYRKKLDMTRAYLGPQARVVEFGCGTGSTALALAPSAGHILATDAAPRMLEIARGKAEAVGIANVTFQQTTVEDFTAPPASFDMVSMQSLLHLLADKEAAIAKAHALLKPGGVFVSSTACLGDFARWFALVGPLGHALRLLPRVRIFKADDLRAAIEAQGFAIEHDLRPARNKGVFIVARKT